MKRNTLLAAIPLIFALNANAAELFSDSHAVPANKGLVVAVTESGTVAADTAWLLSNQVVGGREIPILLVLKPETRSKTLNALQLETTDLPALIFLNSNGSELSRVIGAAPVKLSGQKAISMN